MSAEVKITKDTLDEYLKELGKEFRKLNGTAMPAEIILVGGASVVANYGFRDVTYDIDAFIKASSAMQEAITRVGDKHDLPYGWINSDFTKTCSFTPKIAEFSKHYRTFSNILNVRTVTGEYLIAMKLMSGRVYKYDLSDIVGILHEQQSNDTPIGKTDIERACKQIYGDNVILSEYSQKLLNKVFESSDLLSLYNELRDDETENKQILKQFDSDYPGVLNAKNISSIIENAKSDRK
jgi:hypothetical protein